MTIPWRQINDLAVRAKSGDVEKNTFFTLFGRHLPEWTGIVLRRHGIPALPDLVEDCAQQAAVFCLGRHWERFDPASSPWTCWGEYGIWYGAVVHLRGRYRQGLRLQERCREYPDAVPRPWKPPNPESVAIHAHRIRRALSVVDHLPAKHRVPLRMVLEGSTTTATAIDLGLTSQGAHLRVAHAVACVADALVGVSPASPRAPPLLDVTEIVEGIEAGGARWLEDRCRDGRMTGRRLRRARTILERRWTLPGDVVASLDWLVRQADRLRHRGVQRAYRAS